MTIGEKIKAARIAKGLTQEQLSRATILSTIQICRYERGDQKRLTVAHAVSLCKVLDLTIEELAGENEEKG